MSEMDGNGNGNGGGMGSLTSSGSSADADDAALPRIAPSALRAATLSSGSSADADDALGGGAEADDGIEELEQLEELDEHAVAWRALPLQTRIEALLFAATEPLSLRRLAHAAGDVESGEVSAALEALSSHYRHTARAFDLREIGGGYQLRTTPELAGLVARVGRKPRAESLSKAAMETLAIVAYRQPVLRADVEKIRGVASGEVLRTLIEKGLARVAGRADLPGAPLLYGTTSDFLELFGLRNLNDLPSDGDLLRRSL